MKKIGIIYNAKKKQNVLIAKKLEKYLQKKKIKTSLTRASTPLIEWKSTDKKINTAIIIGGDGTLLASSRALAPRGIPVVGFNTGHLGFLTEGKGGNIFNLVNKVLRKKYRIEERAMLSSCIYTKNKKQGPLFALNDVVLSRGTNRKMIHFTVSVNKRPVADYVADGLIVATPTGSTAYALSAGGAVMDPEIQGIQIVPICAHTLTSRPHIVSEKKEITITFNKPYEGAMLQFDGQETFNISSGSKITITTSRFKAKLIRLLEEESNFYPRIREKFHWGMA